MASIRAKVQSIFAAVARPAVAAAAAARTPDSVVLVNTTMNNIHACVSDLDGQVVASCSGGMVGQKHRARASVVSARDVGVSIAKKAAEKGFQLSHVHLKGPSTGRSQLLRGLVAGGLAVHDIRDVTPAPTNGCRPPKARRL